MKPRLLRMLGVVLVGGALAIGLAACGDDDDGDDGDGDTTPAVSTQPAAATEPAGDATEAAGDATEPAGDATEPAGGGVQSLTVTAADFSFTVEQPSVDAGAVVEVAFSNSGSAPHTLTFYTDAAHTDAIPGADSGQVAGGDSVNFTFEAPEEEGTAFYRCEVHPAQMEGELTVAHGPV